MQHVQMKLYLDGTVAIDFYNDEMKQPFGEEMAQIYQAVMRKTEKNIHNNPFYGARCPGCGHLLITNRDRGEEMECQSCHQTLPVMQVSHPQMEQSIAQFEKLMGLERHSLEGRLGFMLVVCPKGASRSKVWRLMDKAGLKPFTKNCGAFRQLLTAAQQKGWLYEEVELEDILFGCVEFTEKDVEYNGSIPRLAACDVRIRESQGNIYTLSMSVNVSDRIHRIMYTGSDQEVEDLLREEYAKDPDNKTLRDLLVQVLTQAGKMDEAVALLLPGDASGKTEA